MNSTDMKGTSIEATLPIRLIPPMIMIAASTATIIPIIILTNSVLPEVSVAREKVSASAPEILFV